MTIKIPVPRKPNAPFAFKPRGLGAFLAQVARPPLPARSPFGPAGMCGFFVNAPETPWPGKNIFPQFVQRQNGGQCASCARPCGHRQGMGDYSTDFGYFGSDPISVDPSTGSVSGWDTYTPTTTSELELSTLPSDLVGQSGYSAPPSSLPSSGNEWILNPSGSWVQAPASQVNAYLAAPSTSTASAAVVAARLAANAAQGISSVASGLAPSVSSAVLSAAQQAALKANPNLTAAQLQSLAPGSGVSQWLAAKNSVFPSETNQSLLITGGVVAAGVLLLSKIIGGKKRR